MEIESIEVFLGYLRSVRKRTKQVIHDITPDEINWRPTESSFSFADIIRHIGAISYNMFGRNALLLESAYPGHGQELATSYDDVLIYLDNEFEKLVEVVENLNHEDLNRKCVTPAGVKITVWKWLRSMIEHEIHHRGQIYTYLKLHGSTSTPLYGLTSEQVKERSISPKH